MPVLLSAQLHRFAMLYAEDRATAERGDPVYDEVGRKTVIDIGLYHRNCMQLAEGVDAVDNFDEDTNLAAYRMFLKLAMKHPRDYRYRQLYEHHWWADDGNYDFVAKCKGKAGGKDKGGKDKGGKGTAAASSSTADDPGTAAASFAEAFQKGMTKGLQKGMAKGRMNGMTKGMIKGWIKGQCDAKKLDDLEDQLAEAGFYDDLEELMEGADDVIVDMLLGTALPVADMLLGTAMPDTGSSLDEQ